MAGCDIPSPFEPQACNQHLSVHGPRSLLVLFGGCRDTPWGEGRRIPASTALPGEVDLRRARLGGKGRCCLVGFLGLYRPSIRKASSWGRIGWYRVSALSGAVVVSAARNGVSCFLSSSFLGFSSLWQIAGDQHHLFGAHHLLPSANDFRLSQGLATPWSSASCTLTRGRPPRGVDRALTPNAAGGRAGLVFYGRTLRLPRLVGLSCILILHQIPGVHGDTYPIEHRNYFQQRRRTQHLHTPTLDCRRGPSLEEFVNSLSLPGSTS